MSDYKMKIEFLTNLYKKTGDDIIISLIRTTYLQALNNSNPSEEIEMPELLKNVSHSRNK